MPVLPQPKWELFAQGIAKNLPRVQAYVNAGHARTSAHTGACRLIQRPQVVARIRELQDEIKAGLAVNIPVETESLTAHDRIEKAKRDVILPSQWVTPNIAVRQYRLHVYDGLAEAIKSQLFDLKGEIIISKVRELRELMKQAAMEAGQWSENQNVTVRAAVDDAEFEGIPVDRLRESAAKMEEALGLLIEGKAEEIPAEDCIDIHSGVPNPRAETPVNE